MSRLLLLACSQRKTATPGLIPAIDRYNGPAFQVLRRYSQSSNATLPITFILSAEYGLISASTLIPTYDRRINTERALVLQPSVKEQLSKILRTDKLVVNELMVCAGKNYLVALGLDEKQNLEAFSGILLNSNLDIKLTEGSIGRQIAMLHDWLHQSPPILPSVTSNSTERIVFKGKSIQMSSADVIALITERASHDLVGAARYESWYVLIDEMRIAPKWILHQMTGIPVSQFKTQDALRVLTQLGIEIKRV